jgi:hypothetical protein
MRSGFVLAVAALVLGCQCPQQVNPPLEPPSVGRSDVPAEYLVVPGVRAGSLFLGTSLLALTRNYDQVVFDLNDCGLLVQCDADSSIVVILATKAGYGTSKGVVVGDPPSAVIEAYGHVPVTELRFAKESESTHRALVYPGIAFLLSDTEQAVWGIQIGRQWPSG